MDDWARVAILSSAVVLPRVVGFALGAVRFQRAIPGWLELLPAALLASIATTSLESQVSGLRLAGSIASAVALVVIITTRRTTVGLIAGLAILALLYVLRV